MKVDISWDASSAFDWQRLFERVSRSNVLQSWAYGEAKAAVEGVSVRRGTIRADGELVGLVQALERRVAGIGRIVRINRGPLWLISPDRELLAMVLSHLQSHARWWRLAALLMAPELPDLDDTRALLRERGFWSRRAPQWQSAWVDLCLPEEQLRGRLAAKWRNALAGGERAGARISVEEDDKALDWILLRQQELRAERGFASPSSELLRATWSLQTRPRRSYVLRAHVEGAAVAGMLILCHGTTATYLLGWADEAGRKAKASNLLLWSAFREAQNRGCASFDLGGIDDVNTPGIARFKRGVNGIEYRLVGEYVSC